MYVRRFVLCLTVIAIVLIHCGIPASASITAAAQSTDACAYADSLLTAGLLSDAQGEYEAVLKADASATCAAKGLGMVRHQREVAVKWEAAGDVAAAKGQLMAARQDYLTALNKDQGNAAALTGLQNMDEAPSGSVHEASDLRMSVRSPPTPRS